MPFIPVPNVAHCRLEGTLDGQQILNNLYFEISGGGITPTNIAALALAVRTWYTDTLTLQLSEYFQTLRVVATDLTTQNGVQAESADTQAGAVTGEAVSNNVAAVVSFRTGIGGRSYRGRNYVAGMPGSVVTQNLISGTFSTNLLTAYGALIGAGTFLAGWQWCVVSRYANNLPRVAGVASPVTNVLMVSQYVRSMRTRNVGIGS